MTMAEKGVTINMGMFPRLIRDPATFMVGVPAKMLEEVKENTEEYMVMAVFNDGDALRKGILDMTQ